jgi:ribosomal-protein-serine acetyltransferase
MDAGDAPTLGRIVQESLEHLRPWMPWVAQEPMSLSRRRELIAGWERAWRDGGDVCLGIFTHGQAAGSCGLHRRIGPGGLEIGYWIHPAFVRRGLATETARLLTRAALTTPGIERVEIHPDKANHVSGRIPRKLRYELVEEMPKEANAPSESGVSCRWRMTRDAWAELLSSPDS